MDRIREDDEYGGFRIRTTAGIGDARIAVATDIGFGDATEPCIEMLDHPVLLDVPPPRLRGYAPETVVAEKFQAIVALGRVNSRMRDDYDLWMRNRSFDFERSRLAKAISGASAPPRPLDSGRCEPPTPSFRLAICESSEPDSIESPDPL